MVALAAVDPKEVRLKPHKLASSTTSRQLPRFLAQTLDEMARCVIVIENIDREIFVARGMARLRLIWERNQVYVRYLEARAHVAAIRKNDKDAYERKFKIRAYDRAHN